MGCSSKFRSAAFFHYNSPSPFTTLITTTSVNMDRMLVNTTSWLASFTSPPADCTSTALDTPTGVPSKKPLSEKFPEAAFYHMNRHSRSGGSIAGTRFITLIFVSPSIFKPIATIIREPTQVISAMTASPRKGARKEARRAMAP